MLDGKNLKLVASRLDEISQFRQSNGLFRRRVFENVIARGSNRMSIPQSDTSEPLPKKSSADILNEGMKELDETEQYLNQLKNTADRTPRKVIGV